ncbi:MAG: collagen binding domain-containing protein, partial [Aristaeellaceae bacterium]
SYWDMDSFYAFSGGAPAVYLTYARWLATNAIAHASITGNITVSNQSVSISGSNYIGSVTLTTDADLIRIPKEVGTLTGNTGGSDSSYYYAKSGDTIRVSSTQSWFAITMESMPSDDEEACFLVGLPSVRIQKVLVPVYGSPYPLKSASVTFELSYGEIRVTKQSTDGLLLKDAGFELLNASGTVVATAATDNTGSVLFPSLQPGSYTVREKTAPQGYSLAASASQTVSVVAGVTATICFVNERITGRIRIVKTDSLTGKPLAGVVFSVTRMSGPASDNAADIGKVVATVTTNTPSGKSVRPMAITPPRRNGR